MARTRTKSGKKQGENQKTRDSEGESPTSPQLEPLVPPAPWSDIALPVQSRSREDFRIPVSRATVRTDPGILPEVPKESRGLFEMVSPTARRALELGLAAKEPSFHVFVAAEPEVMIEDDLVRYAERFARARGAPPDILYVHDFDRPAAPTPIMVPAGMGAEIVAAVGEAIDALGQAILSIAKEESVKEFQQALSKELDAKNKAVLNDLEIVAKRLGFGIRSVPGGMQTFPILHGKPLSPEQFAALDESTKRALSDAESKLTREVDKAGRLVQQSSATFEEERTKTFSLAAEAIIHDTMENLKTTFKEGGEALLAHFERVEEALVESWEDLVQPQNVSEDEEEGGGADHDPEHAQRLNRFQVNLLVSSDPKGAAPVVYERNPTYPNLFGYLERRAKYGALLTDFTRVRAGALHFASGGFLILRASDLLTDPIIWERMKRVLRDGKITAEDPLGPLGLYATSLRPVPVPIRVRVILVGPPDLYAALLMGDPDFAALFRIKVEVEQDIPRNEARIVTLDAYLMHMAKERQWGRFDRSARAKLIDLATRLADDQERLSLFLTPLEETAAFASALAAARATEGDDLEAHSTREGTPFKASITPPDKSLVTVDDIELAWRERRDRAGAAERHTRALTLRGEVHLDTTGARPGVVNGLSVYSAGDVEFGQPMRITAVVALGREGIVDVERESQLGGALHTKGVAIVRGYLSKLFGQERPLSLRAQIAFEQSYGEVDGDSASSAELYAVLSALTDIELEQSIAVTGSVNQLGEIQAIGGVCAKIEGFFDLCAARGLTGKQGVMIPRTNITHLVLREDVVKALEQGKFHLYSVATVQEGIEVLTGIPAGERDSSGRFPASSVFGRVERRLIEIAERLRRAESPPVIEDTIEDASSPDLDQGGF